MLLGGEVAPCGVQVAGNACQKNSVVQSFLKYTKIFFNKLTLGIFPQNSEKNRKVSSMPKLIITNNAKYNEEKTQSDELTIENLI